MLLPGRSCAISSHLLPYLLWAPTKISSSRSVHFIFFLLDTVPGGGTDGEDSGMDNCGGMSGVGHIMGGCGIGDGVGHIMGCCGTEDGAGHSIMDGSGTEACIGSKDEGGNQDEGVTEDESGTPRFPSPWS